MLPTPLAVILPLAVPLQAESDPSASLTARSHFGRWPDAEVLQSLYGDLITTADWEAPSQQALSEVDERNLDMDEADKKSYTKWAQADSEWMSYREYVGNKDMWGPQTLDIVRIVTDHGLAETHMFLDVGCGALRAGKLIMMFMQRGHYHCIEPNRNLIQDAVKLELGLDMLQRKLPRFAYNNDFIPPTGLPPAAHADAAASATNATYDLLVAQSIFTHTANDMFETAMANLAPHMGANSTLLATFFLDELSCPTVGRACIKADAEDATGWYYGSTPETDRFVYFEPSSLSATLKAYGLKCGAARTGTLCHMPCTLSPCSCTCMHMYMLCNMHMYMRGAVLISVRCAGLPTAMRAPTPIMHRGITPKPCVAHVHTQAPRSHGM